MEIQRQIARIALMTALLGLISLGVSFAEEPGQPQPPQTVQKATPQGQSGQGSPSAGRKLGPTDGTGNQEMKPQDGTGYGSPGRRQAGQVNRQSAGNGSGKGTVAGQCTGAGRSAGAGKAVRSSGGAGAGTLTRSRARSVSGVCTGTGSQSRRGGGSNRGGRR